VWLPKSLSHFDLLFVCLSGANFELFSCMDEFGMAGG
jgi:hypothetical protein